MHALGGFYHVAHLAEDVLENDALIVELLHAPLLLRVEELHLLGTDDPVVV